MSEALTRNDVLLAEPNSRERVLTITRRLSLELVELDDSLFDIDFAFLEVIDDSDPLRRQLFHKEIAQLEDDQIEDFVIGRAIRELHSIRAEQQN